MALEPVRQADAGERIAGYITDVVVLTELARFCTMEAVARFEAEGRRIVTAGRTGLFTADGRAEFEVRDWRSGELIVRTRTTMEGFHRLCAQHGRWYRIEEIEEDTWAADFPGDAPGIPLSLAQVLDEWIANHPDEAKEIALGRRRARP